jgi:hypothetical protein
VLYKKISSSTESTLTRNEPSEVQASLAALHVADAKPVSKVHVSEIDTNQRNIHLGETREVQIDKVVATHLTFLRPRSCWILRGPRD